MHEIIWKEQKIYRQSIKHNCTSKHVKIHQTPENLKFDVKLVYAFRYLIR